MKTSDDALLAVLKTIVGADDWIDLWDIRIKSGYSLEYTRQAIKVLYWKMEALQRMKKGAKYFYRSSAKAQKILTDMNTVRFIAKLKKEGDEQ